MNLKVYTNNHLIILPNFQTQPLTADDWDSATNFNSEKKWWYGGLVNYLSPNGPNPAVYGIEVILLLHFSKFCFQFPPPFVNKAFSRIPAAAEAEAAGKDSPGTEAICGRYVFD